MILRGALPKRHSRSRNSGTARATRFDFNSFRRSWGLMNSDQQLTHARAERWRTDWKALDFEQTIRRLEQLYWLQEFVMAAGESIPQSWQQFLNREIAAGEARREERPR